MVASYDLDCTGCPFQTAVVGEFEDALDEIDAHQQDQLAAPTGHFVNAHRRT